MKSCDIPAPRFTAKRDVSVEFVLFQMKEFYLFKEWQNSRERTLTSFYPEEVLHSGATTDSVSYDAPRNYFQNHFTCSTFCFESYVWIFKEYLVSSVWQ